MEARVRGARASDKAPLMSFVKDIWGGHDYIPEVWDSWLRDRRGRMFVVEVDGVPVGMNRVRFLGDGSAWFEGARVHPMFRRRGLATMLGENSMRFALKHGASVFRLTSGSSNRAAHRQIARIGFKEKARFSVYGLRKGDRPDPRGSPTRVGDTEADLAMKRFRNTKEFSLGAGVFWHEFTAASLTPKVVEGLTAKGAVWTLGESIAVIMKGMEGAEYWEEVSFLGGSPHDALSLLGSLLGREKNATERLVFLPQGSPLITAVRKERFVRTFSMVMFERRAPNG